MSTDKTSRRSREGTHPPTVSVEELHQRLTDAIGAIETGDQWRDWLDFAQRLAAQQPALAAVVTPLLADYATLRFGADSTDPAIRAFDRAVRRVRLARHAVSRAA